MVFHVFPHVLQIVAMPFPNALIKCSSIVTCLVTANGIVDVI
jgi:hypothetical protein